MKRVLLWLLLLLVPAFTARAESIVVIVRHAEKASGESDDPSLSEAGRARAATLSRLLQDSEISAIFTTEFKRTKETATPIANTLKITPTVVRATEITSLADKLHELHGNALVGWAWKYY